ncbi:proteasome lid subunit RPN8/RPN11 [Hydrogenispora ethanolica]|jgi:proteasome lid subunit RPN8/RPN11|uniref:Proteasome lid subunit RPN8/RPN11 n=1 Tax=Hydrogenispora ethanolica TaxID=1082276 RepID=A0A4V2QD21_HYDET|nr:M67 family metallopeptidase [Hydrogenispora ethanolica]TCL62167.1 proteasome lid subunit RPN8/RPN11 [Hydrogenispora ethanolica]
MLRIPVAIKEQLIAQTRRELPNEACGYLAGQDETVKALLPMTNADHSPEHFSFIPEEQFRAVKASRAQGLRLIAVYHSHPSSPARLSEEDLRLLNDPDLVYLIVSFMAAEPAIKAYRVRSREVSEIVIEFTEEEPA